MSCFTGFIGAKGCSGITSESGLYINNLPGVTLQSLDMVANSEQATFVNVFRDIELRAGMKLENDIITYLKKRYKLKNITQSINFGKRIDPQVTPTPSTDEWRGFSVDLGWVPNGAQLSESQLQVINIQSLSLYVDSIPANPIVVKIVNKETGEDLWMTSFTPAGLGWHDIPVNMSFGTTALMCMYNANDVDTASMKIPQAAYGLCQSCTTYLFGPNCRAMLYGYRSIGSDPMVYEKGWDTFGLTGVFSIGCTYNNLICDIKMNFATVLLYAMGIELMIETLYSERLNYFTTIKAQDAEALKGIFEGEYETRLANALDGIEVSTRNCCIECNYPIQVRESRM